jgi:hypothetical protein
VEKTALVAALLAFGLVGAPQIGATRNMAETTSENLVEQMRSRARGDVGLLVQDARAVRAMAADDVRADLAGVIGRDGANSADAAARQAAVGYLAEEVETAPPMVARVAAIGAQRFRAADFSPADRARLAEALASAPEDVERIRAAAVAAADVDAVLRMTSAEGFDGLEGARLRADAAWTASLALARLGDPAAFEAVLVRVQSEEDDVALGSILYADLAFTAQVAALDWLVGQLAVERRLPKLKATQARGAPIAWYAARAIVSSVAGAPDITAMGEEEAVSAIISWRATLSKWSIRR